jgi:lipopolysaccharide transport system ATP-binding protein
MNHPLTHDALFTHVADDGDYAIRVENVFKRYAMFKRPEDRLKQMIVPRLQRAAMLEAKSYYKEFSAVSDVSLNVRRGETIGIIGRNGSGKSTLLQMIVGTLQPSSGSVTVKGRIAALLELGAGFNMEFTGRENVYVNGAILGFSRAEMDERFEAIAAFADIGEFIEHPVKTYSSGMFVRLAFAVSTAVEPDILVVDEALSVGDEAFQRKCFARIEAIKARGGTILFVSHGAQTIVQLCDRAILLDAGEKILEGEPKQVVAQFQRLINASPEAAIDIRSRIISMGVADEARTAVETAEPASLNFNNLTPPIDDGTHDFYDPALISTTAVASEERGARISDIEIVTRSGKRVNNLKHGRRYVLKYNIHFDIDAYEVGFGMTVRNIKGVVITGAQTFRNRSNRISKVEAGTVLQCSFEFPCAFMPDAYFINCGVNGLTNGEAVTLNRWFDALMFKVMPENGLQAAGQINLDMVVTANPLRPTQD